MYHKESTVSAATFLIGLILSVLISSSSTSFSKSPSISEDLIAVVGDILVVDFRRRPGTNYVWRFNEAQSRGARLASVKQIDRPHRNPAVPSDGDEPGASEFAITLERPGVATLVFDYIAPGRPARVYATRSVKIAIGTTTMSTTDRISERTDETIRATALTNVGIPNIPLPERKSYYEGVSMETTGSIKPSRPRPAARRAKRRSVYRPRKKRIYSIRGQSIVVD